eukprot:jgi/Mesvir1/26733/Mv20509-RA.1
MGVSDIFAFERKDGDVVFLKPRDDADPMFVKEKRVKVLDDPVYQRYAHAQSLCDVVADGKTEAKQWLRFKDSASLIAELEKEFATGPGEITRTSAAGPGEMVEKFSATVRFDEYGPRRGTWIHPKLVIPFLMWVNVKFALKAYDWVERILAGDLTLCAEIAQRHDAIHGTETTAVFTTAPAKERNEVAIREETDLRIRKAKLESIALTEEYRVRMLAAVTAQQKLLEDASLRMSDRDKLFLKDKANDILYTDLVGGKSAIEGGSPSRKSLDISTVARDLGYKVDLKDAGTIGRAMAQRFRGTFPGKEIPKTERFVDGAVRFVNWYEDEPIQRKMMEDVIEEVMEREGKRPVKSRRMNE